MIMYPRVACTRIIPVQKTTPVCFKESEGIVGNHSHAEPYANIGETNADYFIALASPGFSREDFQIEIENSIISIAAKKEVVDSEYIIDRCEYNYSAWSRSFLLPDDADSMLANAEYINGELFIHIPRSESNENIEKASIYVY